jgi:hypothetical protein
MKVFWSLLILSALTQLAHSDCTSPDLRKDPRMPPIRMQGDVAWCYAAVATDLLSFKMGKNFSYLDLAVMSNPGKTQLETHRGGQISDVLAYAKKNGVCSEQDFPEDRNDFSITQVREEFKRIEDSYTSADQSCGGYQKVSEAFPKVPVGTYLDLLNEAKTPLGFVKDLEPTNCPARIPLPKNLAWVTRTEAKMTGAQMLTIIREQLKHHNPVGIDYSFHLRNLAQLGHSGSFHASTLVGMRPNPTTGKCEYLLRNQGGTICKNPDGSSFYDAHLVCEGGYIWVPETALERDLLDYTYFTP